MRAAPVGAYFAEDADLTLRAEAVLSASITHAHREGKAGAVAIAVAAAMAWRLRGRSKEEAAATLLRAVCDLTPEGETRVGIAKAQRIPFSTSLEAAARVLGNGFRLRTPSPTLSGVRHGTWTIIRKPS
jgi:ADP-ribosylglycohydrolase